MDSTTKNPRVVAIHLGRIERHLSEAFREANRIAPEAFEADVINNLRKVLASAWADAQGVQALPVIIPEKPKKVKAEKPMKDLVVFAPTVAVTEVVTEAPVEATEAEDDTFEPGAYDHLEAKFDNA